MTATTSIEWTEASWNPVRGCSVVSPGCTNCYAMKMAHRFSGKGGVYEGLTKLTKGGPVWTGKVSLHPELLDWPLHRRKPSRIFVNSMSDLFHEDVPDEFIDRVFAVMASAKKHTFQILTKRADRMKQYMQRVADGAPAAGKRYEAALREDFERYKHEFREGYSLPEPPTPELRFIYDSATRQEARPTTPDGTTLSCGFSGGEYHWRPWPLSNVWLGVSVEDQARADERIPLLLQTPAAVRWISAEPLIGPVTLRLRFPITGPGSSQPAAPPSSRVWNTLTGYDGIEDHKGRGAGTGTPRLDWVVAGGESGPGARPLQLDWVRSLRDQCHDAGIPFFLKQLGRWPIATKDEGYPWAQLHDDDGAPIGEWGLDGKSRKGGDPAEWPQDLRIREYPR